MYDREASTKAEREEAAAYHSAKVEDRVRGMLREIFTDTYEKWAESAPHTLQTIVDAQIDILQREFAAKAFAVGRKFGVETRHGSHNRIAKLRCGERSDKYGESMDRWFVIDVPEGWLDAVVGRGKAAAAEYDQFGYAEQEYVEQKLAELTLDEFGFDVHNTRSTADYSPTGRWYSSVYARQVGTRLLVTEHNYLDC